MVLDGVFSCGEPVELLTNHVEHEADKPVVRRKGQQYTVNQNNVFEVVYHALPIEEIHRRPQKVPVQSFRKS